MQEVEDDPLNLGLVKAGQWRTGSWEDLRTLYGTPLRDDNSHEDRLTGGELQGATWLRVWHTGEMDTRHIPPASIVARWNPADQAVDLVIDGRTIIDIVDPQRQWGVVSPFARRFTRTAARECLAEYRGVFGNRDEKLAEGELEVAVCGECGDLGCGNLAVCVDFNADTVVWRKPHWAGDDEEDDDEPDANDPALLLPQILIFNRAEYDAALADTEAFITRAGWHRERPAAAQGDDVRQGILGPSMWLDRLRNRFTSLWDN